MSEHRRGVDEADLVRALQRAGAADAGVDVPALAAGARGRARTIRRRRQGVAGVVAVLALGIPVGVSQWPGTPPTVVPPATTASPAPTVTSIPDDALLTTADVTAVVRGLEPLEQNPSMNSGFCRDNAYDGSATVVDSRDLGWGGDVKAAPGPFPENVNLRVLLFRGTAAQDWMAATAADAQACVVEGDTTSPWTLPDDPGVEADQVIAGTAQSYASDTGPMWNAKVVARSGQLVVTADVQTYEATGSETLTQAVQLVNAELTKAAGLRDAGGAAR